MTERDYAPLSVACVRGLCEKLYDKRKFAGGEIEKMVKDFNDANNTNQIKKLIRVLGQDLMSSTNPNVKNGALMGLSSVAVGLGQGCVTYLSELTHPIIACLGESEARVRYAATEALFNVLKIARSDSLTLFPIVFDALARLAADPEAQVRQGAELLDRLVKDIVVESGRVTLTSLVPLLRARLAARAAGARQFAVGWVCALDAAPALGLRAHLPELLDPLMAVLDDPNPEIRRMCEVQLNEFLRSIKKEPGEVDFQAMINILIAHAQSTEDLIQLTAITWLKEFVELAGASLLPHASGVLAAALPALAYHDDARRKIRETAAIVNFQLMNLVVSDAAEDVSAAPADVTAAADRSDVTAVTDRGDAADVTDAADKDTSGKTALNLDAVVGVLTKMLNHNSVHTKVATLDWILHLYTKLPNMLTAITWLKEFVELAGASLLPHASGVLAAALPALAYHDDARRKIRETAAIVNFQLMNLVVSDAAEDVSAAPADVTAAADRSDVTAVTDRGDAADVTDAADKDTSGKTALNLDAVVGVLTKMLNHNSVHTKVATLDWILHLYTKLPNMMYGQTERVFGGAVGALTDPADDVVRRALAVLAEICSCPAPAAPTAASAAGVLESSPYYHKFLRALLRLLAADENLLEDRGAFIIRQLCVLLGAEEVFGALARILRDARELRFAARLVDVLSSLLLTAAELHHTRRQLRAFADPATHALFEALYASWCHSPVALLSLCLLTHNYSHCNRLIATFGDLEITVDFLTEVDKLVQLIESPIFAYLRLELLGGAQSAELRGALFGLLMLLPQSDAFHALRRRLQCAPAAPLPLPLPPSRVNNIDFDVLLQQFVTLQEAHRRERLLERRISRARLHDQQ